MYVYRAYTKLAKSICSRQDKNPFSIKNVCYEHRTLRAIYVWFKQVRIRIDHILDLIKI